MKRLICGGIAACILLAATVSAYASEVLIVTWRGKTDGETGFENRLKKLRPDVKFKYIDAGRKKEVLGKAIRSFDFSKVDLVYTFGTTATRLVKGYVKEKKPLVFNMVSTPVGSKVAGSIEKPGNNLTGAKLLVNIDTQLEVLSKIKQLKAIGIWIDPREKNTPALLDRFKSLTKEKGITLKVFRVIPDAPNFSELVSNASEEAKKLDAVYIAAHSSYVAKAKDLLGKLDPSVIVLGALNKYIGKGATIAVAADYKERGEAVAELAHKILSGENAGDLPINVLTSKTAYLYVDKKRAESAGLKGLDKLGLNIIEK
ncbi:MAG: ABC transporter substrate-binding protein [Methyloligellaceae bacterium]